MTLKMCKKSHAVERTNNRFRKYARNK